ncbi:hypothetical protein RFI_33237, partial [Reticulomyxa filosa]
EDIKESMEMNGEDVMETQTFADNRHNKALTVKRDSSTNDAGTGFHDKDLHPLNNRSNGLKSSGAQRQYHSQSSSRSSSISASMSNTSAHFKSNGNGGSYLQTNALSRPGSSKSITNSKKLQMLWQMVNNGAFQMEDVILATPYMGLLKFKKKKGGGGYMC